MSHEEINKESVSMWSYIQKPINGIIDTTSSIGSTVKSTISNTAYNTVDTVNTIGKTGYSAVSTTLTTTKNIMMYPLNYVVTKIVSSKNTDSINEYEMSNDVQDGDIDAYELTYELTDDDMDKIIAGHLFTFTDDSDDNTDDDI